MKFGRQLHRHIVPEWDQYYINYNGIKQLIKASLCPSKQTTISEAYRCLDENIQSLEAFRRNANALLLESYEKVRARFGLPGGHIDCQILDNVDHAELLVLLNASSELQQDLAQVQWFDRVNKESVEKLFTKFERLSPGANAACSRTKTRWLSLQGTLDSTLSHVVENVNNLVARIRKIITKPKPGAETSLFLGRIFENRIFDSTSFKDLALALRNGDEASIKMLESIQGELGLPASDFQGLLHGILEYLVFIHPNRLALPLIYSSVVRENAPFVSKLLGSLIITTGQRILEDVGNPNIERLQTSDATQSAQIVTRVFEYIVQKPSDVLQTKDWSGRLPLHYATMYGLTGICGLILRTLVESGDLSLLKQAIISQDKHGLTVLHYAVIGKHGSVAKALLDVLCAHDMVEGDEKTRTILTDILILAIKYEDDALVSLLLDYSVDLGYKATRGETALHIAAQFGRHDYTDKLLQVMSKQGAQIDIPELTRGWTPLFIACVGGSPEIVKLLLEAGASQDSRDYLGWTAKEHAAFRGYLPIAELFEASELHDLGGGPADVPQPSNKNIPISLRPGQKAILVTLGSNQARRNITAVNLTLGSSESTRDLRKDASYVLEISSPGTSQTPVRVLLPILDDKINNPFAFHVEENAELQLILEVFQIHSSTQQGEKLVAAGTTVLRESESVGAQRQNMIQECAVSVLEHDTMRIAGCVNLTYLIARPYSHLQTSRFTDPFAGDVAPPLLVGHRGLGQNTASREYLQLGENTVESALSAAQLGAAYVEFGVWLLNKADVQVTRDLEPVIYHDFSLSETGTDVPIHDVTLEQFIYAGNIQSPHGNPISVLGKIENRAIGNWGRPRSRSVGRNFEEGAVQVQDRMKYTIDFKEKGFKPNTRGNFVQDSLATLGELLAAVPEKIGFDVEIKYPRLHEAQAAGVAPIAIEMNTFIDTILDKIHQFAGERRIIISSFTPDICILLSMKQRAYPVMFITNAGKVPMSDMELRAASLQVAVHFAKRWNLAGVVFACETLLLCPRLVQFVNKSGLLCASYGILNNVPSNAKKQAEAGVGILVVDRVGIIAKAFTED